MHDKEVGQHVDETIDIYNIATIIDDVPYSQSSAKLPVIQSLGSLG